MSSMDEDSMDDDCTNQDGEQECLSVDLDLSQSVEINDAVNEVIGEDTDPKENTVSSQPNPEIESISNQRSSESSFSSFNLHQYQNEFDYRRSKNGVWPNVWYTFFPCLSCCIGMHAVCRIALMTVLYGGAFVIQFALLSTLVGVPFFIFMVLFGQRLGSGLIQMWFISPGLKGIGIALQVSYTIFLSCNISPAAWIVHFFTESLISNNETYKWSNSTTCSGPGNISKLNLNIVSEDLKVYYENEVANSEIEFQQIGLLLLRCAPHITIWFAMTLLAVKGIKVAFLGIGLTYVMGSILFVITTNRISSIPYEGFTSSINIDWTNLKNVSTWIQSAKEVFFTWMMLGGIILHVCSHNATSFKLRRYFFLFLIWTVTMLSCAISWGASLRSGLEQHGASLRPTLFNNSIHGHHQVSMIFTHPMVTINDTPKHEERSESIYQLKNFNFINHIIGDTYFNKETGHHSYKVLRAATELLPILISIDCAHSISPPFISLFYLSLLGMEFAQQLTILISCIDAIAQVKFCILSHPFCVWITIFIIQISICLFLNSKVGFPVFETFDISFSSAWGCLTLMAVIIFVLLKIQRIRITFESIVQPLFKNTNGFLFSVLEMYSSFFLPMEISVIAITLFIDSVMDLMRGFSGEAGTNKLTASVFQYALILFVILFFFVKVYRSSMKYGNMKESLVNALTPQLATFIVHREFFGRNSSVETIHAITADQTDDPPEYSPPPSYSLATSRHLATKMQRSHSAGEVMITTTNIEDRHFMTTFSTNQRQAVCETIVANTCSILETEV